MNKVKGIDACMLKAKGETNHQSQAETLCPNCSEMVFRISGDFKEVKAQVFNMIEWIEMEFDGRVGDGPQQKLDKQDTLRFKEVREQVKNCKSLEELEQIVISFTCNYETFFKAEDKDLLVATCNNYTYDNVSKQEEGSMSYYDVAGKTSYTLKEIYDGSMILKLTYDDVEDRGKFSKFIICSGADIRFQNYDGKTAKIGTSVDIIGRNGAYFYINDNRLERIEELQDKDKLNKIKIALNLEKSK
jgi:hypothetical protein